MKKSVKKVAAATAAATAMYMGTNPDADAEIIENTTGFLLTGSPQTFFWDIDGVGGSEYRLGISDPVGPFGAYSMYWASATNISSPLVNATGDAPFQFRNLPLGFTVGAALAPGYGFGGSNQFRFLSQNGIFSNALGFTSGQRGYVGFSFQGSSGAHYGYAEVTMTVAGSQAHAIEVHRWAYEGEANLPIQVGAVPEPSSASGLALLACGMAGVCRWRRRKADRQDV